LQLVVQSANVGVVEAVNFNAPAQVVIAGEAEAVQAAMKNATDKGAKRALILPVSVPAHSSLMRPAAAHVGRCLRGDRVSSTVNPCGAKCAARVEADSKAMRQALVRNCIALSNGWVRLSMVSQHKT
jgi:[acyl-carrier-protein] S-malonyltransferase